MLASTEMLLCCNTNNTLSNPPLLIRLHEITHPGFSPGFKVFLVHSKGG